MRVIGGLARGRKLMSPDGYGTTRPTLDRVKESMFNIIQNRIYGACVLDIFAGTGSLGLEAVSRGAKKCYLVDKDKDTFFFLKKNVENLGFSEMCETINVDSHKFLKEIVGKKEIFDIIFIDPPYKKDMIPPIIEIVESEKLLREGGIIVTKIDTSEKMYDGKDSIILSDYRKYGNTTVCFYKYKED
ncbi:16S rRNA (guanine(966)-N(2))-methyltransferase RsmD [Clostridium sp. WILCCON 0269]|uniref:16S rRNA (Guanine(966)-N(2))-methyltransferase RsmD n=1 Tax=Candidatus Clostridium eludens TaxID=3381663 RepID=A0ABW8SIU6_9CLOT